MKWYLVGGAVRDILMEQTPKDADLAFSGTITEALAQHPDMQPVGRSVTVFLLHGRECMPLCGGNIASDLMARDLTINALALDEDGMLHAHPLALADLAQKILRPASPTAFFDDPTRIYRMARFAARFPDFSLHPEAILQAQEVMTQGLHRALPAERVGNELRKALACPRPSRFLRTLAQCQGFNHWFKELEGAEEIPAGPVPWHTGSVLAHTAKIMDAVAGEPLTVWLALCHDLGKVTTDPALLPHHYGHESRGACSAETMGQRLALPAAFIRGGELAARLHMKGGIFETLRSGTKRDLLHAVHSAGLDLPFWQLVDADSGKSVSDKARRCLEVMLEVRLPEEWRNQGADSGKKLRLLQCAALSTVCAPRTSRASEENPSPPPPEPS